MSWHTNGVVFVPLDGVWVEVILLVTTEVMLVEEEVVGDFVVVWQKLHNCAQYDINGSVPT